MNNVQSEFNSIALIMQSKDPTLLAKITPDDYGNQDLKNIHRLIQSFWLKNGSLPGWQTLVSQVVALCRTKDRAEFMTQLLLQIQDRDIEGLTSDMLIKELGDYRKFRLVIDHSTRLISAVESKDIDGTLGEISQLYEKVYTEGNSSLDDADALNLMGVKQKFTFRKIGIPQLDERGCFIEGGFYVVGANTGKGKSNFAIQACIYQLMNYEGSVAYFSYELTAGEIYARVISQIAEVDVGHIMSDIMNREEKLRYRCGELQLLFNVMHDDPTVLAFAATTLDDSDDEFKELAKNTFEPRKNRLYISDETCCWSDLFVKMAIYRDTKGVKFFCTDYITIIPFSSKDRDKGATEEASLRRMSQKLKLFAKEDGKKTYILSPAQFDEKEAKLRYASGIKNDLDLMLSLTEDKDDTTLGTITCTFEKMRTFLTVPDKPQLKPFKMLKDFQYSRFLPFEM